MPRAAQVEEEGFSEDTIAGVPKRGGGILRGFDCGSTSRDKEEGFSEDTVAGNRARQTGRQRQRRQQHEKTKHDLTSDLRLFLISVAVLVGNRVVSQKAQFSEGVHLCLVSPSRSLTGAVVARWSR